MVFCPTPNIIANNYDAVLCDDVIGLDYVSHDDVIPYTSTSLDPFFHVLFGEFLVPNAEKEGNYIY